MAKGLTNIENLKVINTYTIKDVKEFLQPSREILKYRTLTSKEKVEAIQLYCYPHNKSCEKLAQNIAKKNTDHNIA